MRWIAALLLLAGPPPLAAQESGPNVNSRYRVESVEIKPEHKYRLSASLKQEIRRLVGENLNQDLLDGLAARLRRELRVRTVHQKLARGSQPETVKVVFEIERWGSGFDLSVPKLVYHSRQGWTAAADATVTSGTTRLGVGIVSDGDELMERYAGVRAGFERLSVFTERLRLSFDFASFHQQWNAATLAALEEHPEAPGIYRTRQIFEPALTVEIAPGVSFSAGVSFQRFQMQFPAARTAASNAVMNTLRLHRVLEAAGARHDWDAGYTLRAATNLFDSDFVYARHHWRFAYTLRHGRQRLSAAAEGGVLNGRAPLFERFVLGNFSTLRGWNKFDLAPLGGERMAHGALEYQYRIVRLFYDTGSVWDRDGHNAVRHSLGLGLHFGSGRRETEKPYKEGFTLAVAFPLKDGRAAPVFLLGTNF